MNWTWRANISNWIQERDMNIICNSDLESEDYRRDKIY